MAHPPNGRNGERRMLSTETGRTKRLPRRRRRIGGGARGILALLLVAIAVWKDPAMQPSIGCLVDAVAPVAAFVSLSRRFAGKIEIAPANNARSIVRLLQPRHSTDHRFQSALQGSFSLDPGSNSELSSDSNDRNEASANINIGVRNSLGEFDPNTKIAVKNPDKLNVGDPQQRQPDKEFSVNAILKELAAIQQQGPQKYCILGTRHCSYLHQQIIELLAYALVLSGNHVYTSGASGTNAATIRGALRAERHDLLTVVVPQCLSQQTMESQDLLRQVYDVIEMPQNRDLSLDIASRICNSYLLSLTDQLISFAFHESSTVIEATKEAKKLDMLVTVLFLD